MANNTKALRRRIKSVQNTSQITKAMQMVAATKMRKAQLQALAGRPYSETLTNVLLKLSSKINPEMHKLLQENNADNIGVIVLSSDKGLCGALNTNLFRALHNFLKEVKGNVNFYTVGKKGRGFILRSKTASEGSEGLIVKTQKALQADFENPELVTFRQASQIAKLVVNSFLASEIREAYVLFPQFISTLRQEPRIIRLLPVSPSVILNDSEGSPSQNKSLDSSPNMAQNDNNDYLYEPNVDNLLDYLLTHYVETKIYQALLETKASEHSSRMIAMQNATDNAKDLVEDLKLTYNQTRQEAITKELLEITTASLALQ
ncbi:ATP synthase F1 subunit gamma [Candidatus Daviesbacteria bacterium]|nr:ATP synthase F1 subunit gamma [Candidatus Daviesbacteria bacterium]